MCIVLVERLTVGRLSPRPHACDTNWKAKLVDVQLYRGHHKVDLVCVLRNKQNETVASEYSTTLGRETH